MNKDLDANQTDRYFRTSSFYTAVFLFARGLELVNIDYSDPKRSQFVFLDTPEREQLIHDFSFAPQDAPEIMVDARKFVMAIKMLKDKLYQGRS